MGEEKVPTCPFCEKQHEMDKECLVKDLKRSMTGVLAKYLQTAGMQTKIDNLTDDLSKSRELVGRSEDKLKTIVAPFDVVYENHNCEWLDMVEQYRETARAALELIGGKK